MTKKLLGEGYTRVVFFQLPEPMGKPEAALFLKTNLIKSTDIVALDACNSVIGRFATPETKVASTSTANLLG